MLTNPKTIDSSPKVSARRPQHHLISELGVRDGRLRDRGLGCKPSG